MYNHDQFCVKGSQDGLEHEEKKGSLRDQFHSLLLPKDQMLSHRWMPTSNTKIEEFWRHHGCSLFLSTNTYDMRLYGAKGVCRSDGFAMGSDLAGSYTADDAGNPRSSSC